MYRSLLSTQDIKIVAKKGENFVIERVLKDLILLRGRFTIVDGFLTELYNI
jgi:hypothetical protein